MGLPVVIGGPGRRTPGPAAPGGRGGPVRALDTQATVTVTRPGTVTVGTEPARDPSQSVAGAATAPAGPVPPGQGPGAAGEWGPVYQ